MPTDASPTTDDPDPVRAPDDVDPDAGARGALYALLGRAFDTPDEAFYGTLVDGTLTGQVGALLERTDLDVEPVALATADEFDTLAARYNDLFAIGYSEYTDRTDGSLSLSEPPVPLYETAYRTDVSWNDVNLDLARAYDYYGVEVDDGFREHHDHLRLQLQFAGYLARREAAADPDAALARLDFLDRHLRILVEGVEARIRDEVGTDVYGPLADLLDAVTAADRADLAERLEEG